MVICVAASAAAQAPGRMATTVDAPVTSALFYNGKDIAIRHGFKNTGAWTELEGTARPVFVAPWSLTFSTGG